MCVFFLDVYDDISTCHNIYLLFFVDPLQVVVLAARKHPQALQHASCLDVGGMLCWLDFVQEIEVNMLNLLNVCLIATVMGNFVKGLCVSEARSLRHDRTGVETCPEAMSAVNRGK